MTGVWLALQFFTAVPIHKEYPLGRKEVTAMYAALPFVGAAIGIVMYARFRFDARRSWDGPAVNCGFHRIGGHYPDRRLARGWLG